MKFSTVLDRFRRKNVSESVNLQYLIICEGSGQPIYTKCWGNVCGMLGKKDELLTAFLAAISSMPGMFAESDKKIQNMSIGSLKLFFCYTESENIICLAFQESEVNNNTMGIINELLSGILKYVDEGYQDIPWDRINDPRVRSFQKNLLEKVIYPWFHVVLPKNGDLHEENCPLCMPMILTSCT